MGHLQCQYTPKKSIKKRVKEITCLPILNSFVISRQKEKGTICCLAPPDLVDFLLNLQTLQIIKLNDAEEEIRVLLESAKRGNKSR